MNRPAAPHTDPRITSTRRLVAALVLAAAALSADLAAQQDHSGHDQHASPYADLTDRAIKALSAEQVEGLETGQGIGFALAAELNGVPGPLHSLEMAEGLGLDAEQIRAVEAVQARMRAAAVELGTQIVALEAELDRRFAHGHIDAATVGDLTGRIAELTGRLRAVHLVAHLETAELLSVEQVAAYARMRGYGG